MRPWWGWVLAAGAIGAAWLRFGWQGALFAVSAGFFVLLLQFNRTMRTLRDAGQAPIGQVGSAVMLNSRLRKGMQLPAILGLTRSLGEPVNPADATAPGPVRETFRWRDAGGVMVDVELVDGRCHSWSLKRPPDGPNDAAGG